jgi:environmental stress-induced protein Ves
MQILRAADYKKMPWKNGAGFTTEIAISPAGSALDAFDWRVSMARVEDNGAFSLFPEIDRTLLVLDGAGMALTTVNHGDAVLDTNSKPYAFPGDQPTSATLTAGGITDLNVMSRRSRIVHDVERIDLEDAETIPVASTMLVFVERGGLRVQAGPVQESLSQSDGVVLAPSAKAVLITPAPTARVVIIAFSANS